MLPVEKTKIKENLFDYVILIHGVPKIGKSTLISEIGNVLFADCEGGLKALEVYKSAVTKWNGEEGGFLKLCNEFTTEKHKFSCMAIDTIDALHKICVGYIMKKYDITHPSDLEWGKGYDLVKTEFLRPLLKLSTSGFGLILISHTKQIEVQTRTLKITKWVPDMPHHAWSQIEGFVDIILYAQMTETSEGEKRYMVAKPSENWIAGDRTTRLLKYDKIPMTWKSLTDAFKIKEVEKTPLLGTK